MPFQVNRRLLYTLASGLVIFLGTFLAIQYASGAYRFTESGVSPVTGLLSANSFPNGAEVYIDDRLVSATDDTIYLKPGSYQIEIRKDGFWPWRKTVDVEGELVTQTNAQLFPIAPSLVPLTFTGVENVTPSPDGQKILYYTASASAQTKNGLYVLELVDNLLSLQRGPKQIAQNVPGIDLSQAQFIWSPDSTEVMVLAPEKELLVSASENNNLNRLPDISFQKSIIFSEWEEEMYVRERQFLGRFPEEVIEVATESAKNVYISPDKKRLLYTYVDDVPVVLPPNLVPPVPAPNNQPESRRLQTDQLYVYDREEDRNFSAGSVSEQMEIVKDLLAVDLYNRNPLSLESSPSAFRRLQATTAAQLKQNFDGYHTPLTLNSIQWFPDSKHLLYVDDQTVKIKSYDGTNDTTVYSGPFADNFVYPWPDGSKLLILTTFNPNTSLNLYAIEMK